MDNLQIISRRNDVTPFYNEASIVLNLSDKQRFVETFGLTALEAMSAGLPVIVPTEGGIAENALKDIVGKHGRGKRRRGGRETRHGQSAVPGRGC